MQFLKIETTTHGCVGMVHTFLHQTIQFKWLLGVPIHKEKLILKPHHQKKNPLMHLSFLMLPYAFSH
jgi:hypothetical protein